ncbi:uncharacterized protein BKA55DRAFT_585574 [Fusarium redolens]|uniref:Zn(2)-C6 fungal-type domain-containing protein n=1 Tax=Fusarium redolens TaxID=48865 RepID=A0A9P9JKP9_FUSRE|nr:uncharacterized protein BKA55DRAFT_585574 [Fusarium redolens]KAH7210775.1 hypothetical protein BKA55DRAFT_585574 [Fusarium redolens]
MARSEPRKKKYCRTRSGCLPCRRRRRKCDGHRPVCWECETRHVECAWGLKVSFHPSRALHLSSEESAVLSRLDKERHRAQPDGPKTDHRRVQTLTIIDDTQDIVRSFYNHDDESSVADASEDEALQHPLQEHDDCSPNVIAEDIPSYVDGGALHNEDCTPEHGDEEAIPHSDQNNVFHSFSPLTPVPHISPPAIAAPPQIPELLISDLYAAPFSLGQAISRGASPEPEPRFPVSQTTKINLMTAYIKETATWCETTDSEMHFSAKSVHEVMNSKPFVAAAMSLASRQLDAVQGCRRPITLELYQYTIRLLLGQDPTKADASILATCTILCAYEMMASNVSEWRRHLRGCADLLRMCKWNGNSQGIIKSCFWAFARIDVWAAFILNQTTLIPTDSWVDCDSLVLVAEKGGTDDYCNLAILIFARIINVLNVKDNDQRRNMTQALWEELQRWRHWRLPSVKPFLRTERLEKNPFPTVMFALSASICGNTFYHAGSILLLQSGLVTPARYLDPFEVLSPHWHARELGGISVSNSSHANWVNHLQPLYIAGTVFDVAITPGHEDGVISILKSGRTRRMDLASTGSSSSVIGDSEDARSPCKHSEFAAEKIALLGHLAKIERETGWKTSDRAKDLRILWGLEN